jgi:hypothetical protein
MLILSFVGRRRLEVGGSVNELARYVTPFSRRVGHWLTDTTQLMPLMAASDCDEFVFDVTDGGGYWLVSTNLRSSIDLLPYDRLEYKSYGSHKTGLRTTRV